MCFNETAGLLVMIAGIAVNNSTYYRITTVYRSLQKFLVLARLKVGDFPFGVPF